MNDAIRQEVRAELERRGWRIADVAERLGKDPRNVSRLLSQGPSARGKVPEEWQQLLDVLGYEVTIRPKQPPD